MRFRDIFFISSILMSVLGASISGKASSVENVRNHTTGKTDIKDPFEKQNKVLEDYQDSASNVLLNVSDNVLHNLQTQQSIQEANLLKQMQENKNKINNLGKVQESVLNNPLNNSHIHQAIGENYQTIFARYYSGTQLQCLIKLVKRESGGRVNAVNKSSGAWGLFQALPATKMASYGGDWKYNAYTQTSWGVNYIKHRYQTPCGAWGHELSHGWY